MRDGAPSDKPSGGPDDTAGGPAFPWQRFAVDGQWFPGMTLRDYFAAAAMQAMHGGAADIFISSLMPPEKITDEEYRAYTEKRLRALADTVYAIADAMLRERAKS